MYLPRHYAAHFLGGAIGSLDRSCIPHAVQRLDQCRHLVDWFRMALMVRLEGGAPNISLGEGPAPVLAGVGGGWGALGGPSSQLTTNAREQQSVTE
jgi:hypothetical protein